MTESTQATEATHATEAVDRDELLIDYPGQEFAGHPVPVPTEPVSRVRLPTGDAAWLVTGFDEVRTVLTHPALSRATEDTDPQMSTGGRLGGDGPRDRTLDLDGTPHADLRRLATTALNPRRVLEMRPRIQELTNELLDGLERGGRPGDLVAALAHPLPMGIVCELLGVPKADQRKFSAWSAAITSVTNHSREAVADVYAEVGTYLFKSLAAKRERPGSDLISRWLGAQNNSEQLTDTEIVHLSLAVLVAGHETTVNAIGSGVWRLFQEPEALAALRADPDLLPGAVDELLRFQPQGATFRMLVAREDVTVGKVVIRAGEGVMPLPFIANRDPRRFTDPDRFDIRRTDNRHITFGHGPHACFGAVLARTELEVALGTLLRRFPGLRPAQPVESLTWRTGQLVGGLVELPVTW